MLGVVIDGICSAAVSEENSDDIKLWPVRPNLCTYEKCAIFDVIGVLFADCALHISVDDDT